MIHVVTCEGKLKGVRSDQLAEISDEIAKSIQCDYLYSG